MAYARKKLHADKFSVLVSNPGWQELKSYSIPDNCAVRFEITVVARQTDGANRATFKRVGLFFRQAGGPVQIQGNFWHTVDTTKSDKAIDIRYALGSSAVLVQVKNSGSVPTRWNGYLDLIITKT